MSIAKLVSSVSKMILSALCTDAKHMYILLHANQGLVWREIIIKLVLLVLMNISTFLLLHFLPPVRIVAQPKPTRTFTS
jgi:hypothetical protein